MSIFYTVANPTTYRSKSLSLRGVFTALCLVALVVTVFTFSNSSALANVTGEGDVTPAGPTDLPIGGGTATADVIVGDTSIGRLTIDAPAFTDPLNSPNGFIGNSLSGIGQVTVSGFDLDQSQWDVDTLLTIGVLGQGFFDITGGGRVAVGDDTLTPGTFITGDIIIGDQEFSQGVVTVNGFGSIMETHTLTIGEEGNATLDVSNRGNLRSEVAIIGNLPESIGRVTLTGLGTRWVSTETSANDFVVGEEGRGTLEILNGAMVLNAEDVSVGRLAGSRGVVTLSGQDSLWQIDDSTGGGEDFDLGTSGNAEMYISDTALLRVSGDTTIGATSFVNLSSGGIFNSASIDNNGVIRGGGRIESALDISSSGELRNKADVNSIREYLYVTGAVDNSGTIESIGGEMEFQSAVTSSLEIIARDAILRFKSGVTNTGIIAIGGNSTIHGTVTNTGGSIFVLSDSESLLKGDLIFTGSSTLGLTIGDAPGTLDVLGMASFDSTVIELNYSAGNAPSTGDMYQIFQASGGISGAFSPTSIVDGLQWDISSNGNALFATFAGVPTLIGADFNGDGTVDIFDLTIWESNYPIAGGATKDLGDADGDGDVDGADFLKIQRDFGAPPVPAVAAAGTVPEPSSALLLVFGSLLIGAGSRGRKRC